MREYQAILDTLLHLSPDERVERLIYLVAEMMERLNQADRKCELYEQAINEIDKQLQEHVGNFWTVRDF